MFSTAMVWLLSLELCIACAAAATTAGGNVDRSPITLISAFHFGISLSCQQHQDLCQHHCITGCSVRQWWQRVVEEVEAVEIILKAHNTLMWRP
jgi:hypothetical protein